MGAGYFSLTKSGNQFKFVLKAGNHETILNSELYAAKSSAQNGIASVKANSSKRRQLRAQDLQGRQGVLRPEGRQWRSDRHERAVLVDLCSREGHRILQGQRARPNQGRDLDRGYP